VSEYAEFLRRKMWATRPSGFEPGAMNARLRPDQRLVTERALRAGRYAIFADCGLGKTLDELEWGAQVAARYGPVLILSPLCVALQTQRMAAEFGYEARVCKSQDDVTDGVNITNYDRLDKFHAGHFAGLILDESSILKHESGKTRNALIDAFAQTPYKLACSATPAPNDFAEIGNHAEFFGVMRRSAMLSMFFVHDGGATADWRLKGHAQKAFWDWVATWSTTYSKPSELNPAFSDAGFSLPPLHIEKHIVHCDAQTVGLLFDMPAETLSEQRNVKRRSVGSRVDVAAEIASGDSPCVAWCDLNDEADAMADALDGSEQICGADSLERKEELLWAFTTGQLKKLVTKQKITGFGLNWQHCNRTVFVGPNYSYEAAYQAIKRFHRFGQTRPVTAHWVMADLEYNVFRALMDKMAAHTQMREALTCETQ